jgi:hypothetical protein
VADIQWRIFSSRYIYSGRYTAAETVPDIQYRIKIYIHRGRYIGVDTQRLIYNGKNNGRYTQQQIHSGRYTAADTQW